MRYKEGQPDGAGGAMIAWEDYREDEIEIFAVHLDADGLVAAPVWNQNGNPVSGENPHDFGPFITSDNYGGAVIVWEDYSLNGLDFEPEYFNIYAQRVNDFSTGIANPKVSAIPNEYSLSQNYPNPFNPSTTFSYSLPKVGKVNLKVFDITGREVVTLVNGMQSAGQHQVVFNAKDLTSGVYFARLTAGDFRQTRKVLLTEVSHLYFDLIEL